MLAHADAMLGHGGFGTTMGALAAGVPQVVMPIFTSDQLANAEHVAAVGAGIAVPMGPGSVARRPTPYVAPRRPVVRLGRPFGRRRDRRPADPRRRLWTCWSG